MKMITTEYEIFSDRLPDEFDGLTVAHVSDLHNSDMGTELISALEAVKPDLIAITGDSIHIEGQSAAAEKFATSAVRIAPTYFVAGNHERVLACYSEFKNFLKSTGIRVLENQYEIITRGAAKIALIGMNDPTFFAGKKSEFITELHRICNEINAEGVSFTVLLSHRPELFEQYADMGIDLSLCGHTHGGHVRFPIIGAFYAPGQGLFPKYSDGKFEHDGKFMIISKGLGKSSWVPRIFNPPELVVERLFCKKRDGVQMTETGAAEPSDDSDVKPINRADEPTENTESQIEAAEDIDAEFTQSDLTEVEQGGSNGEDGTENEKIGAKEEAENR